MQIDQLDRIDRARAEWAREDPALATSPMEVVGRILRAEGLDRGGFDVLATLRRSGPPYRLTPTALYRELVLTSGAMTHRVDALARAGLVERMPDPADRRGSLVGLTPAGRSAVDRAMAAHMACEAAMLAVLPGEDRRALAGLLKQVLCGIEDEEGA